MEKRGGYAKCDSKPQWLENSLSYLRQLATYSAIDLDNFLLARNNDFSNVREIAEILEKRQVKDSDDFLTPSFYGPLWRAIRQGSDKSIKTKAELALEMRLLRCELEDIPNSSREKIETARDFLVDFSKELQKEMHAYGHPCRRLAA